MKGDRSSNEEFFLGFGMPQFNSPSPPNLNYQQPNGPTPSLRPNPIEHTNKPRSITASQSKFLTALLYLQVSSQPRLHCIQIVVFSELTTMSIFKNHQGWVWIATCLRCFVCLCFLYGFRALFTGLASTNFSKFFFKTGFYSTIHTFKNYFIIIFLVFSFQ